MVAGNIASAFTAGFICVGNISSHGWAAAYNASIHITYDVGQENDSEFTASELVSPREAIELAKENGLQNESVELTYISQPSFSEFGEMKMSQCTEFAEVLSYEAVEQGPSDDNMIHHALIATNSAIVYNMLTI